MMKPVARGLLEKIEAIMKIAEAVTIDEDNEHFADIYNIALSARTDARKLVKADKFMRSMVEEKSEFCHVIDKP